MGLRNNTTIQKASWVQFITESDLLCAYLFQGNIEEARVKIITHVQRGYYHSARNEALEYFEKNIIPTLKENDKRKD